VSDRRSIYNVVNRGNLTQFFHELICFSDPIIESSQGSGSEQAKSYASYVAGLE
jgi:hypothetical protein